MEERPRRVKCGSQVTAVWPGNRFLAVMTASQTVQIPRVAWRGARGALTYPYRLTALRFGLSGSMAPGSRLPGRQVSRPYICVSDRTFSLHYCLALPARPTADSLPLSYPASTLHPPP